MLSVQAGDLYRLDQEFSYMEGEVLRGGDLHLVTRADGRIVYTMRGGKHYTWYAEDFISCAERVEEK